MERPAALEEVLTAPREGEVYINGSPSQVVPVGLPYLFQLTDATGAVVASQLVPAGQKPPGYATARKGSINVPLAVAAGVSGAVAGGTWYLATAREKTFWDPSTPTSDLQALQQQANTFGTVALSAGVVTLGTGAAAVLVGVW